MTCESSQEVWQTLRLGPLVGGSCIAVKLSAQYGKIQACFQQVLLNKSFVEWNFHSVKWEEGKKNFKGISLFAIKTKQSPCQKTLFFASFCVDFFILLEIQTTKHIYYSKFSSTHLNCGKHVTFSFQDTCSDKPNRHKNGGHEYSKSIFFKIIIIMSLSFGWQG